MKYYPPPLLTVHFVKAWLLATLASLVAATLTFPMILVALDRKIMNAGGQLVSLPEMIIGGFLLLPFGVLAGSVLALPLALLVGICMTVIARRFAWQNRPVFSGLAGFFFAMPATLVVGSAYALFPDRTLITLWIGFAGFVGGTVMHCRISNHSGVA